MMRPEHVAVATQDWNAATLEDKARAATEFLAYCGRYEVRADHLVHHIEQSLTPNVVGTAQTRFAWLDGDHLTLTTEPIASAKP